MRLFIYLVLYAPVSPPLTISNLTFIYIQIKCIHRHSEPKTGQNTIETKQQKKSYATVSLLITRINCLKLETKSIWQFICFLSLFAFFFANSIASHNLIWFVLFGYSYFVVYFWFCVFKHFFSRCFFLCFEWHGTRTVYLL